MWLLTKKQTKRFWIVLSILIIAVIIFGIIRFNIPNTWRSVYVLTISILALLGVLWVWKEKEKNKVMWIIVISVWLLGTVLLGLEIFKVL
ncbi:MAG: hypothetical protein WCQ81_01245 [Bacteroidales bacterium]|jgi:hypothetical protein